MGRGAGEAATTVDTFVLCVENRAMPKRGTDYEALNRVLEWPQDGLPARKVGEWTRHKLAMLAYYLPKFAELCQKPGGWYYLDGFAGNGVNVTSEFPRAKGSALIGTTQTPAPLRAVLIEENQSDADALRQRCELFDFASVIQGDCNEVIDAALNQFPNRRLPAFCLLDPEGLELDWATVETCSRRRVPDNPYPYELLIYFSTPGAARAAGVRSEQLADRNANRLTRLFGDDSWRDIASLQQRGAFEPGEAGAHYLALYKTKIASLGYSFVMERAAIRFQGGLVYHLIFATNNAAGANIMTDAIRRAYAGQMPLPM